MSEPSRKALWNELLERNERRIVAIARSYAHSSDVADLVQEILLQVWRSLDQFRGQASIDTWAYRIALNVAMTWKRSHRRRARWLPEAGLDPELLGLRHTDETQEERILHEFLQNLRQIDHAVLLLYLDNVSRPQMSEILGMTENAIALRLHRIRQRFETQYLER